MIIGLSKETYPGEPRVALTPQSVQRLAQKGASVYVEVGIAEHLHISDGEYAKAGAKIVDRSEVLSSADVLVHVRRPDTIEITKFKQGAIHISFLDPFQDNGLLQALAEKGITAVSMEMIPRTTIAQKMDALSSQASLAGYYAAVLAAERLNRVFPMMTTPAGTISPARVFVIGAGVAGLQTIATARRLGARVEAFDTRPVVEEQVRSLGAKFIKIDLGETGQTQDGYAKPLTPEQITLQRQGMTAACANADIVITTAQIFGKKAPIILTREMISQMKPGSIVIDMAVESGGNVEGSQPDKEIDQNGVLIIGLTNLPGHVALNASQMYSNNITSLILQYWNTETRVLTVDLSDSILNKCVVTHEGKIRV